ncbi:MAG: DUF2304 domain-containing protein [Rhodoplanes sp.]|uniref:DUF2304 domain-containing protein n=1 Tax=Rhodoplanes sp. TaxID=1968906 RepID=UPI00184BD42A|nr:DUF2304 domain-containing protein [Rhodoplanes sp.]NVO16828.1 DUF2304 domain-containing protein [Rhodoplanes sp.]
MIAQLFLTVLLSLVVLYAWSAHRKAPVVGFLAVAAALAGLYLVWLPGHATWLAHAAGIGRGSDLVVYTWVVISLLMLLNLHLKLRAQMEEITRLARSIALAEAARTLTAPGEPRSAAQPRP